MRLQPDRAEDVAGASAALVFNQLATLAALPAPEAYERLKGSFRCAIEAYLEAVLGDCPPGLNRHMHGVARSYTKFVMTMRGADDREAVYCTLAGMLMVYLSDQLPSLLEPSRN